MKVVSRPWSEAALGLLKMRFLGEEDVSVDEWLKSVCVNICRFYPKSERRHVINAYYQLLHSRTFLPTSAILHNSYYGRGGLSGCIVLPLPSDTEAILREAVPEILLTLLSGTGIGLDFTVLPPRLWHDSITTQARPGPTEILYSIATAADNPMAYAGVKRSAFMASIFIDHPDVFEFISSKLHRRLPNVNISVAVDSAFSTALKRDGWLPLKWTLNDQIRYLTALDLQQMQNKATQRGVPEPDLSLQATGDLYSRSMQARVGRDINGTFYINARTVFGLIAKTAHECGDPGLLNLDSINQSNPTHPKFSLSPGSEVGVGVMSTTAPCGEQPLLAYEVCQLGSLNLTAFLDRGELNFDALKQSVHLAVRLLDDVIEIGDNNSKKSNEIAKANRKIGIGIMGLADTLAELEIPYDTEDARAFASKAMSVVKEAAVVASKSLAIERGGFRTWTHSCFSSDRDPRRNATLTSIAPTGHISTLADCSTSIEPYYLLLLSKESAGLRKQSCSILQRKLAALNFSLERWIELTQRARPGYRFDGTLAALIDSPTDDPEINKRLGRLKAVFRTAHEIGPFDHLKMVGALQPFVDNGISKTINLPHHATVADVRSIFEEALELGLKGITIFRDRSLEKQALSALKTLPLAFLNRT